MIDNGWVCVHRKLLEWEWFSEPKMVQFFMYCLLRANHKNINYKGIELKKGDFICSIPTIQADLKLSVQEIRTCIKRLKSTGEITDKITNKYRIISLCNYSKYQEKKELNDRQNNRQNNSPVTGKQQTNNSPVTVDNNDNNSTMEQDSFLGASPKKAKPKNPDISLQEFYEKTDRGEFKDFAKNFMFEKKYDHENAKLEFEGFENHWQANGKKYKDWHAVFRKWVTSPYSRLSKNIHTTAEKDKSNGQQPKPSKFVSAVTNQYEEFKKRHGMLD